MIMGMAVIDRRPSIDWRAFVLQSSILEILWALSWGIVISVVLFMHRSPVKRRSVVAQILSWLWRRLFVRGHLNLEPVYVVNILRIVYALWPVVASLNWRQVSECSCIRELLLLLLHYMLRELAIVAGWRTHKFLSCLSISSKDWRLHGSYSWLTVNVLSRVELRVGDSKLRMSVSIEYLHLPCFCGYTSIRLILIACSNGCYILLVLSTLYLSCIWVIVFKSLLARLMILCCNIAWDVGRKCKHVWSNSLFWISVPSCCVWMRVSCDSLWVGFGWLLLSRWRMIKSTDATVA